ncbi:unnamed protein product, partial [Amoebophrya sp. A25]
NEQAANITTSISTTVNKNTSTSKTSSNSKERTTSSATSPSAKKAKTTTSTSTSSAEHTPSTSSKDSCPSTTTGPTAPDTATSSVSAIAVAAEGEHNGTTAAPEVIENLHGNKVKEVIGEAGGHGLKKDEVLVSPSPPSSGLPSSDTATSARVLEYVKATGAADDIEPKPDSSTSATITPSSVLKDKHEDRGTAGKEDSPPLVKQQKKEDTTPVKVTTRPSTEANKELAIQELCRNLLEISCDESEEQYGWTPRQFFGAGSKNTKTTSTGEDDADLKKKLSAPLEFDALNET